jgi:hypothetical protein
MAGPEPVLVDGRPWTPATLPALPGVCTIGLTAPTALDGGDWKPATAVPFVAFVLVPVLAPVDAPTDAPVEAPVLLPVLLPVELPVVVEEPVVVDEPVVELALAHFTQKTLFLSLPGVALTVCFASSS